MLLRVSGTLGLKVSGERVEGYIRFRGLDSCKVWGFRDQSLGFRVQELGLWCWVQVDEPGVLRVLFHCGNQESCLFPTILSIKRFKAGCSSRTPNGHQRIHINEFCCVHTLGNPSTGSIAVLYVSAATLGFNLRSP